MGSRWNCTRFQLHMVPWLLCLMFYFQINKCSSLNLEGSSLLEFRASVDSDPHGVFVNWSPNDIDPCMWSGVQCVDGKVQMLILKGLDLGGILSPELGKLIHLRSLILYKNRLSGFIPKEIGGLIMLELLDLRDNNLSGTIPAEIVQLSSLKRLLLCDNKLQGSIPSELGKLSMLSEIQFDDKLTFDVTTGIRCLKKIGHCTWQNSTKQLRKADSLLLTDSVDPYIGKNGEYMFNFARRRLLQEPTNLAAAPSSNPLPEQLTPVSSTRSSGSFPAIPNSRKRQSPPALPVQDGSSTDPGLGKPIDHQPLADGSSGNRWKYVVVAPVVAFLLVVAAVMLIVCRSRRGKTLGPWKTGISGQLQKAFVTGVPKLNRPELEVACEDFSNIIENLRYCTVFKGTLSSGVEIAVVSSIISSSKDWSQASELAYRKKIDTLSRVNHKNFVNLLGYCEEDESFIRTMVFEYAPNGTLFEHLHVNEAEFLDWNARMRILMGVAYCLKYMHHDLNPPVVQSNLQSKAIYLTDDYAAKVADTNFWADFAAKSEIKAKDDKDNREMPPLAVPESNVYSFGILLLEIISGKVPYSEEEGSLENWAVEFLKNTQNTSDIIDPKLKSVKNHEVNTICKVIEECVHKDPMQRPNMREISTKLRNSIGISPDQATPRLSPLWWAELEILSEAN